MGFEHLLNVILHRNHTFIIKSNKYLTYCVRAWLRSGCWLNWRDVRTYCLFEIYPFFLQTGHLYITSWTLGGQQAGTSGRVSINWRWTKEVQWLFLEPAGYRVAPRDKKVYILEWRHTARLSHPGLAWHSLIDLRAECRKLPRVKLASRSFPLLFTSLEGCFSVTTSLPDTLYCTGK